MKRFLLVVLILLVLLGACALAAWMCLPRLGTYLLGKAIGGSVEVGTSQFTFGKGVVTLEVSDVKAKGSVSGTIKKCLIQVRIGRNLYVKNFTMADFDIVVQKGSGGPALYPVPVESARIEGGTLVYEGRKFEIREITVKHFNTGGPFEFSFDGGAEGLGNLKTRGEGLFRDKRSDIKGEYSIVGLEMGTILRGYKAILRSQGSLTYKDNTLTVQGKVQASPFWMQEPFLKKPIAYDHQAAQIRVVYAGDGIEIDLHEIEVRGASLSINIREDNRKVVNRIEVHCGFLDVPFIKEYIDTEALGERIPQVIAVVSDGEARIKELVWDRRKPFAAEINLRDLKVAYEGFEFARIEGTLLFSGDNLLLSGLKGHCKGSTFSNVSGSVPFSAQKDVQVKGTYSVDLRDVVSLLKVKGLVVESGRADGLVEVRGRERNTFSVTGTGSLMGTQFAWKGARLKATGDYVIRDREIRFDPLFVRDGATELSMKGRANKETVEVTVKGSLDAGWVKSLARVPYTLGGVLDLDGSLEKRGEEILVHGDASMERTVFEVPGLVKKNRGVESRARIDMRVAHKSVNIERLSYNLGALTLEGSGEIKAGGGTNLHVAMVVQGLEKVQQFFFFNGAKGRGDVALDLFIPDLRLPLTQLPSMEGFFTIRDGSFSFPLLVKPLEDVTLDCAFNGTLFDVRLTGLKVGESQMRSGRLVVQGSLPPSFSLFLDMEEFSPADFATKGKRSFRIPAIPSDSLLATAEGSIDVGIDRVTINQASATDLTLKGRLRERRLELSELKANAFGGTASLQGLADLSADVPLLEVAGRASGMDGDEYSKLLSPGGRVISGKTALFGRLSGSGSDFDSLLRDMEGSVTMYSRNGIIRRWNLLSKIFGLLNVYDLFRGKVDLISTGLPYDKMGAVFEGQNGVFWTNDFIIDSPSMLITGRGELRPAEGIMNGKLTVSPLVTLDKAISAVPVLRSVIKEKKKGFLFVVYDVKGPVKDPHVSSAYVASIGNRALDILRNIFNLPTEVFEQ